MERVNKRLRPTKIITIVSLNRSGLNLAILNTRPTRQEPTFKEKNIKMTTITPDIISKTKVKADLGAGEVTYYSLAEFENQGLVELDKLPFSIRVLLENVLRNFDGSLVTTEAVEAYAQWPKGQGEKDVPYMPARVVLQDFTGVPLLVDLADMREAVQEQGGDPSIINPLIPTDLVIDHSVQVDYYASPDAFSLNLDMEYKRNIERYKLIKWAQKSFKNMRVVPPGSGIVHQVNLEYLSPLVDVREVAGEPTVVLDTVVGTDSHTPMINGLGVLGWGVGGIEAEAVMLGQPYYLLLPEVVGIRLTGTMPEGATATDLVLTVTEMLRKVGVVGKFVEFFGSGLDDLTVTDRATISNMSPEHGCTATYFPIDDKTIDYLKLTGRKNAAVVEQYAKAQRLYRTNDTPNPTYTQVLELDLSKVEPSLSGPLNPEERVTVGALKGRVNEYIDKHAQVRTQMVPAGVDGGTTTIKRKKAALKVAGEDVTLKDGDVVIAAITSCTNTSNPAVMIGSGLLAKNAVERGLKVPSYVKTSFAPGSKVVTDYIRELGLTPYLEQLGFHTVGFGCTTCIGNSGPLKPIIEEAIINHDLYVTSVLSGNRNFAGRVHNLTRGNFLASPMLVVAYALAGTTNIDLTTEPLGHDPDGNPVFLRDVWPSNDQITKAVQQGVTSNLYEQQYAVIMEGDAIWKDLDATSSVIFDWDLESTYIRRPPYFEGFRPGKSESHDIVGARVLVMASEKVSTDHISPAGAIAKDSPAGRYLQEKGLFPAEFNTYGSRRGNHEVMMRGTFANVRLHNQMTPDKEGWWTKKHPSGENMTIFDAARKYKSEGVPLVVLGANQYGQGSSRDWAAKGPMLLGVRAVIVENFERIHRSNLIGMGILPLQFVDGQGWKEIGLDGSEILTITGLSDLRPKKVVSVTATKADKETVEFEVIVRLDAPVEVEYYRHGGILPYVTSKLLAR